MKAKPLLTAGFVMLLAGCTPFGPAKKSVVTPVAPKPVAAPTPAVPPPPPPPLSIPQTNVELPKAQALDPAALPDETPEATPPPAVLPVRPRRPVAAPAPPSDPTPPPPVTVTPEPRETFQEIVPLAELKRLQDRAGSRRREVKQILTELARRPLSGAQRKVVASIRSFLTLSDQAEQQNDMRQADALAERAQTLAKELQSGK